MKKLKLGLIAGLLMAMGLSACGPSPYATDPNASPFYEGFLNDVYVKVKRNSLYTYFPPVFYPFCENGAPAEHPKGGQICTPTTKPFRDMRELSFWVHLADLSPISRAQRLAAYNYVPFTEIVIRASTLTPERLAGSFLDVRLPATGVLAAAACRYEPAPDKVAGLTKQVIVCPPALVAKAEAESNADNISTSLYSGINQVAYVSSDKTLVVRCSLRTKFTKIPPRCDMAWIAPYLNGALVETEILHENIEDWESRFNLVNEFIKTRLAENAK